MTPEQLDDLFRANSRRGDFEQQPGDWDEMSALLAADDRRRRYAQWVSGAWGVLFVFLIVAGIGGAIYYTPGADQPVAADDSETKRNQTQPRTDASNLDNDAQSTAFAKTRETNAAVLPVRMPRDVTTTTTRPGPAPTVSANALLGGGTLEEDGLGEPIDPPIESVFADENTATRRGDTRGGSAAAAPPTDAKRVWPPAGYPPNLRPVDSRRLEGFGESPVPSLRIPVAAPPPPPKTSAGSASRKITLLASLALEANQVEMESPVAPGFLVGPELRYRLSDDWQLSLRALYGQKDFIAAGHQLGMSPRDFTDEILPERMRGHSHILEFPLSVRYTPRAFAERPRYYLEAGLNSYQILSDHMTFTYAETHPGQVTEMISEENAGSVGSSVRVGGGLALPAQRLRGLEIGAYLELPLQHSMYGQVSLYSLGLQVGVPILR